MSTIGSLILHEYNDETVLATLYDDVNKTIPLNLTGATVEFIYKTSNSQDDQQAIVLAATIVSATAGTIRVEIPNETVAMDKKFFRIDVISGTKRKTAVYGSITVVDL